MKLSYSIGIFAVIILAVAGIFFVLDQQGMNQNRTLGQVLPCTVEKISDNVLALDADTSLMRVMVSLKTLPMTDQIEQRMEDLGISVHKDKQLFNYVVVDIPTESLCPLLAEDEITKVFMPELDNNSTQ